MGSMHFPYTYHSKLMLSFIVQKYWITEGLPQYVHILHAHHLVWSKLFLTLGLDVEHDLANVSIMMFCKQGFKMLVSGVGSISCSLGHWDDPMKESIIRGGWEVYEDQQQATLAEFPTPASLPDTWWAHSPSCSPSNSQMTTEMSQANPERKNP